MSQELLNHVSKASRQRKVPVLKPGYTVRVHTRIKEGSKERIQVFEGLVIRLNSGTGVEKTFTVRKIVDGVGVERIFPFFSPNIEKVEVMKEGKVRRAKLYYMRDRRGKSARLREVPLSEIAEWGLGEPEPEVEEAPEAEQAEEVTTEEAAPETTEEVTPETTEETPAEETPAEPAAEEAKEEETE